MNRELTPECKSYLNIEHLSEDDCRTIINKLIPNTRTAGDVKISGNIPGLHFRGTVLGELNSSTTSSASTGKTHGRTFPYTELEQLAFHSCTLGIPNRECAKAALAISLLISEYEKSPKQIHALTATICAETFRELCEIYHLPPESTEAFFDDNATTALCQLLALIPDVSSRSILSFSDTGRLINPILKGTWPFSHDANFPAAIDIWNNKRLDALHYSRSSLPNNVYNIHTYAPHRVTHDDILEKVSGIATTERVSLAIIPTITSSGYCIPFKEVAQILRTHPNTRDAVILLDDCQGIGRLNLKTGENIFGNREHELWSDFDGVFLTGAKVLGSLLGSGAILWQKDRLNAHFTRFEKSPLKKRHRRWAFCSEDLEKISEWNEVSRDAGMAQAPELTSLLVALKRLKKISLAPWKSNALAEELHVLLANSSIFPQDTLSPFNETQSDSILSFYLERQETWSDIKRRLLSNPLQSIWSTHSGGDRSIHRISLPAYLEVNGISIGRFALNPLALAEENDYAERAKVGLQAVLSYKESKQFT